MENENLKNTNLNIDKNEELREILLKRKAEREKNTKPKQENISIKKAEKFRAEKEKIIEQEKKNNQNFRDYDKEPLVIKSYEKFIVTILFLSNLFLTILICGGLRDIYNKTFYLHIDEYIFVFIAILSLIFGMFIYSKSHYADYKIKFINQYIEFIDNGKLKRKCDIVVDEIVKPFGQSYFKAKTPTFIAIKLIVAIIILIAIIRSYGLVFVIIAIFYCSNIITKFIIYLLINKNLKGFTIFPFIQIAEPHGDGYGYGVGRILHERYYMIYLFDRKIYEKVKKYFLQKNIDIDKLPRKLSIV